MHKNALKGRDSNYEVTLSKLLKVAPNETNILYSKICSRIELENYNNNDQQFNNMF